MNPFIKIGSIPIDLLKEDFPRRAIFLIRSLKRSGTWRSLFIRFLRIEIRRVGRELLLVMSWLGSSVLPLINTLESTFRAD